MEVILLGTNPTKAKCSSMGNGGFTVFGMATVSLEVYWSVIYLTLHTRGLTHSSLVVHFNNAAHSVGNMAVMVIDQLHSLDHTLCKIKESRWIRYLRTIFHKE